MMPDVGKVIKGLECCTTMPDIYPRCEECPYADKEGTCANLNDLHRDALALLKAQDAVEPTIGGDEWDSLIGSRWYKCGACEYPIDKGDRYCRHCGMPVKLE